MSREEKPVVRSSSRREFLRKTSGILSGAALAGALSARAYAGEDNTIPIALIGCGGRGTGAAANALSTRAQGPVKLVALADVFDYRAEGSLKRLQEQFPEQVDVPPERLFVGFDGYKQAIDAVGDGGLVLLATPPAFRPPHLEYAVEKGRHVFMEKSFAVDGPGVRRVLAAGKKAAEKNLKIAGGLMSRHSRALEAAVGQIHEGKIGTVVTAWAYRMHGPVGFRPRQEGMSELAHQVANYSNFTWLNGSFLLDWLIHNLDVCCWVKDAWPVSCQGQGGRQGRNEPDQLFDHYAAEYTFPDGTRLMAQGRHMNACWGFFGSKIHGTTGAGVLGEGINDPRLYSDYQMTAQVWKHEGESPSPYQEEHDQLFAAIRKDQPYNETEQCAYAALVGILGRMAIESGKEVTWEQALNSELVLAPGVDGMTWDTEPPVRPDENGKYPGAIPGFSTAF
ncbi:MAG: gfo/Idh/MocA family oxidoreductase [Patescibacteria group bacterium]|nr:gfo/Idh/MocA family oxidoreductase [Patescibacteria group bacterium]